MLLAENYMAIDKRRTRDEEEGRSLIRSNGGNQREIRQTARHTRRSHATCLHSCRRTHRSFLKVLSFYEKTGVLESVASWQLCRTARNLAAHDYDIEYAEIADHFNSLQTLIPLLYISAVRFLNYCQETLGIEPKQADFSTEFMLIVKTKQADESGVIK